MTSTSRTLPALLAVGALALAACSAPDSGEPGTEPEGPGPDSTPGEGDDQSVTVSLDGSPLDFEEVHCGPSPGNEGRMRLFALYSGGEIQVDEDAGGVDTVLEVDGESTYYTREGNGIDFSGGSAQGEVEVSNGDDDVITVAMDLAC